MIDYQMLQDPQFFKNLVTVQGTKTTLLQYQNQNIAPVVKLFMGGQNGKWIYSGVFGVLCYIHDRDRKCQYLKIHELNSLELLFQCELYYNFHSNYKKQSEHFYYFEISLGFIGLSFQDSIMAENMNKMIMQSNQSLQIDKKDYEKKVKVQRQVLGVSRDSTIKSFFKGGLSWGKSLFAPSNQENYDGQVKSVEHKLGLKWDNTNNCIDTNNIPASVKEQLKLANIKKSDLKNPETAEMIFSIVTDHIKNEIMKEQQEKQKPQEEVKVEKKQEVKQEKQEKTVPKAPELKGPKLPVELNKTEKSARANLLDEIRKPNIQSLKKFSPSKQKPANPRDQMLDQIRNKQNIQLKKPVEAQAEEQVEKPQQEMSLADKLREQMEKRKQAMKKQESDKSESDFSD